MSSSDSDVHNLFHPKDEEGSSLRLADPPNIDDSKSEEEAKAESESVPEDASGSQTVDTTEDLSSDSGAERQPSEHDESNDLQVADEQTETPETAAIADPKSHAQSESEPPAEADVPAEVTTVEDASASDELSVETDEQVAEVQADPATTSDAGGDSGVPLFQPIETSGAESNVGLSGVAGFGNSAEGPDAEQQGNESGSLSGFGVGAAASAPKAVSTPVAAADEPPKKGQSTLVVILFTWASLATILAAWMFKNWPEAPSPLDSLPDDGIKKSSNIISPLERLSSREMFSIGETKQVGNIEITPLKIEHRRIDLIDENTRNPIDPALVLTLRIRNVSEDQSFHPADPAYLYPIRRQKLQGFKQFNRRGYTYSFLHPAGSFSELIFCYDLAHDLGLSFPGQDFPRLGPGESADVVFVSEEVALNEISNEMVWRLKMRKGKTRGGAGVATVIGVRFLKGQVQAAS